MEITTYSICPGGTGKKIKFCSPECLPHLQKLLKMIQGGQLKAALAAVEESGRALPGKAGLMNFRIKILEALKNWDEVDEAKKQFIEAHPDNQVSLAYASTLAETLEDAIVLLEKALGGGQEVCYGEVVDVAREMGEALCVEGNFLVGIWLLKLCLQLTGGEDENLVSLVTRLNEGAPLMLRGPFLFDPAPEGAAWGDRFDEAKKLLTRVQWTKATEILDELSREFPEEPVIWFALGHARALLIDMDGASDALSTCAELDQRFEDAVESEALARMLGADPLGDKVAPSILEYPVSDVDRVLEALLAEPRALAHPDPGAALDEDEEVPPKALFGLVNRTPPKEDEELTGETVPLMVGVVQLFGKQTDREARLEVRIGDPLRFEEFRTFLEGLPGLGEPAESILTDDPHAGISLSRMAISPVEAAGRPMSALRKAELMDELRHAEFADTWCGLPLGILDGKTPDEAAGDPAYRIRLAAAILIVESWQDEMRYEYDFNRLRARLKIPTLGPVDTEGKSIYDVKPIRWHRIRTEKLSDDELFGQYEQARSIHFVRAMQTAGEAILNRPSLAKDDRLGLVFHDLTVTNSPFDESLKYCDQGRRWSDARDEPPVVWDIYEYRIRVARQEMDEAREPFKRIMDNRNHPLAADFLERWMAQMEAFQRSMHPEGVPPEGVPPEVAPQAEPEAGKIWTPDSDTPDEPKQKIWMPGMD